MKIIYILIFATLNSCSIFEKDQTIIRQEEINNYYIIKKSFFDNIENQKWEYIYISYSCGNISYYPNSVFIFAKKGDSSVFTNINYPYEYKTIKTHDFDSFFEEIKLTENCIEEKKSNKEFIHTVRSNGCSFHIDINLNGMIKELYIDETNDFENKQCDKKIKEVIDKELLYHLYKNNQNYIEFK